MNSIIYLKFLLGIFNQTLSIYEVNDYDMQAEKVTQQKRPPAIFIEYGV